ncbi:MAG: hypothetical protein AAGA97_00410 [Pseudomonadota bacterium]
MENTSEKPKQKPIENFRDGAIQVAVWPRHGQNGTFYEIDRTRSYKDKNDEWQKTHLISERDILKARRLEDQAYEAIARLKDQDRALQEHKQGLEQNPDQQQEPVSTPEAQMSISEQQQEAKANMPEPDVAAAAPEPSPDR